MRTVSTPKTAAIGVMIVRSGRLGEVRFTPTPKRK
jgi:hypothetical protein